MRLPRGEVRVRPVRCCSLDCVGGTAVSGRLLELCWRTVSELAAIAESCASRPRSSIIAGCSCYYSSNGGPSLLLQLCYCVARFAATAAAAVLLCKAGIKQQKTAASRKECMLRGPCSAGDNAMIGK